MSDGYYDQQVRKRLHTTEQQVVQLRADRDRLEQEIGPLRQQLDAARTLHARNDSNPLGPWCDTCLAAWPCRTAQALQKAQP